MRKKAWEKLLSSSHAYVSIKSKTYINFVLAKTVHFILHIEKKASLEKLFWVIKCCFQTSKTDPNGKSHAKNDSILLQITSLYTNGPKQQVVVCDNYSPLIEVASEYISPSRFNKLQA